MRKFVIALAALTCTTAAQATPLMSAEWAKQACDYWNSNGPLTSDMYKEWKSHDDGSGYKVIHMYRSDCDANGGKNNDKGKSQMVELTITIKDGKTMCEYGGAVKHTLRSQDYQMGATTSRWMKWGSEKPDDIGMFDMMKLDFDKGSLVEAMRTMTPFHQFLVIAGQVKGTTDACPAK
jgi:putative sterol carrier protein